MNDWKPEDIRRFRKHLNLSLNSFGDLIGVTQRYVIYLEKGVRNPSKTLKILLRRIEREVKEKGELKND
ncbi:MAG: helix-turn-helix transcriptional regulator [Nitrospirae bacterium]|nr:helix-turn-helix transcriptional regulator [Nitrospirota bacterium]